MKVYYYATDKKDIPDIANDGIKKGTMLSDNMEKAFYMLLRRYHEQKLHGKIAVMPVYISDESDIITKEGKYIVSEDIADINIEGIRREIFVYEV